MGSFVYILFISTVVLAKCSLSENTNTELTDLKKLVSRMMSKENEMEKEMKQIRIKNEDMAMKMKRIEIQMTQLQFAHKKERRYMYNKFQAVNKRLDAVRQGYNKCRKSILELGSKQRKLEIITDLKSVSEQKRRRTKDMIQRGIANQTLPHSKYFPDNNKTAYKLTPTNASSDIAFNENITNKNLDVQKADHWTEDTERTRRLLIPATSAPDTSKTVVAFQAQPSHHISNIGDNQHLEFDNVIFSEGPEYDKTTGTFRCFIPGVYVFTATILTYPNKYLEAVIVRNGNPLAYMYGYNDNHYASGTNVAIVRLQAGDRVWVRVNANAHHTGTVLFNTFTTFSGFMLQSEE